MAGAFNRIILVGNLTRDPEIRFVTSGTAVTKFTIAVNRRSKERDQTDYIDIIAWDKLAETCNTYLKKGASCLVEGRLSIRSYETKEGEKRKAAEVVCNTMQMLDRAPSNGAAGGERDSGSAHPPASSYSSSDNDEDAALEDEVPFY